AGGAGGVAAGGIAALGDGALPAPSPPAPTPALPASGGGSKRSHAPAPPPAWGGGPGWGHATKPRCPTVPPRPPPPSPAESHGQFPLAGVEFAHLKLSGCPCGRSRPPANPCHPA